MSNHHTAVIISRALFQTDPMNTRCKENDWLYDGEEGTVSERKVHRVIGWLNKEANDGK